MLPRLAASGWAADGIRVEYAVKASRVITSGGVEKEIGDGRIDYLLEVEGVPVAAVEAKREYRAPGDGLQQAIRYAQQLDLPLAYSTNGHGIVERDLVTGTERTVSSFVTPAEAWSAYATRNELVGDAADLLTQSFNRNRVDAAGNIVEPRWYQTVAVHRVLRAIASGNDRVLLLMATGTGKTFTAMQIVAKLRDYEKKRHPDRNYRVLFLADLDVLLAHPMRKDFTTAFNAEPLHRVLGGRNTSREIYFASYQALSGRGDATEALFADFAPDFFDLVIVDECHRGSASEVSSWRRILEHFSSAVQLGLTATPKRDREIDSYDYFGNPVFEYSLRQGIEDGYLAPYRVRRVVLSPDAEGWMPSPEELDRFGRAIPEGVYTTRDFERTVSLLVRTKLAAHHLSEVLRKDPGARAVIFCVDQEHADTMRGAMVAENPDLVSQDNEWVVRIVGSESEKTRLLEDFTNPETESPVVATTSRLLSTGVDIPDLKYVVLFRPVGSMVEFKQIIGRGTRLYPEKGKTSFTVIDYVGATKKFSDPDFDGYPVHIDVEQVDDDGVVVDVAVEDPVVAEPDPGFVVTDPSGVDALDSTGSQGTDDDAGLGAPPPPTKLYVDNGSFHVVADAIQVPDTSTGRLVLVEYSEFVKSKVRSLAGSASELAVRWSHAPDREAVLDALADAGIDLEALVGAETSDYDPLDVLLNLAWNQPPLTRAERARNVRSRHAAEIAERSEKAQQVLTALLDQYAGHGIDDITSPDALSIPALRHLGGLGKIAGEFGGAKGWHDQVDQLQEWLYSA